jgi:dephospho-CoA kinase
MKTLFILRGIPGSGKTTIANALSEGGKYPVCTADDFFMKNIDGQTVYKWDRELIGAAHEWCRNKAIAAMVRGEEKIFIANTNTTEKEMKPYFEMAAKNGYIVVSMIVENRHGGANEHNVPAETIEIMKNRLLCNIKL